ncbi:alpha/beta fold hydrolase [Lentzea sp. NPDC004782]|uniref:thioesterase II family protein n=1 Tax=Lentzea sp. NPDC004782 TaxID=3154458 RepID=UPI0033B313ED
MEISDSHALDRVLYAVPHAGAGASAVRSLCKDLSGDLDAVAVRFPGRESRMDEEPIGDVATLADGLAEQIGDHAAGRVVHLYGHCSGAIVAFETARRLGTVAMLTVSGHWAPDRMPEQTAWRLPTDEFLAKVAGDGYLPPAVVGDPELSALVEPALRADYRSAGCYRSTPGKIQAPIRALLGAEDHAVAVEDAEAWGAWTTGRFELTTLPGGHNLLLGSAKAVADAIRG